MGLKCWYSKKVSITDTKYLNAQTALAPGPAGATQLHGVRIWASGTMSRAEHGHWVS